MGESMAVASIEDDKMVKTAASTNPSLEVSVSFGRFESDSLSWEKWSSFSPNKYLEEVEKCATPGSVAQKKAYFEAHYKKIAARKAELLDQQENVTGYDESVRKDVQNGGDLIHDTGVQHPVFDASDGQTFAGGDVQLQEPNLETEMDSSNLEESIEDVAISTDGHELPDDDESDDPALEEPEEAAIVKEDTQVVNELPENSQEMKVVPTVEDKTETMVVKKEAQKMIPMSKVTEKARVKKKPTPAQTNRASISTPKITKPVLASRGTKSRPISTPKLSKPVSTSGGSSSSVTKTRRFSTPKSSKPLPMEDPLSASQSVPLSINPSAGEKKKVAPKALHVSLNVNSPKTDPIPLTTARTSFIMEQMRDKDIVRRAFKTFEKNFEQLKSSAVERSLGSNPVSRMTPVKANEANGSSSPIVRKENAGSTKASGLEKRTAKAAPSVVSLKSEEKRTEFPKKSSEKFYARPGDIMRHRPKSKEEKESEIKKLRQNLNIKSTVSGFYQGQKVSKSPLYKEGSRTLGI